MYSLPVSQAINLGLLSSDEIEKTLGPVSQPPCSKNTRSEPLLRKLFHIKSKPVVYQIGLF